VHPDRCVRVTLLDGRSPGSRVSVNRRLPGLPVAFEAGNSPLTVAGAAAASERQRSAPRSLFILIRNHQPLTLMPLDFRSQSSGFTKSRPEQNGFCPGKQLIWGVRNGKHDRKELHEKALPARRALFRVPGDKRLMRQPSYTTAGTEGRRPAWSRRRTAFNAIGAVVLLLGLSCATIVYFRGRDHSARQADDPGTYNAESGWTDDTLPLEDTKGSSRDLELNFGRVGALIVNGWRQLEGLQPFESSAAIIAAASLLTAFGCFFVAHRSRGP
jgi:hypothetical protein